MLTSKRSLINLSLLLKSDIELLFGKSLELKLRNSGGQSFTRQPKTAALLFFEPSTRTRFSFEAACVRAGVHPMIFDGSSGTSLLKGESVFDTILNIEAMRPLFFIIRCDATLDLHKIADRVAVPVINAQSRRYRRIEVTRWRTFFGTGSPERE